MSVSIHRVRKSSSGEYAVDQGEHYGMPISYNPDDERFYLHAPLVNDGTTVIATFAGNSKGWTNCIAFARRKSSRGA